MNINWNKVDAVAGGLTQAQIYNEALFALGGRYSFNGYTINFPTAGSFVLLDMIDSPYISGKTPEDKDIDNAFFILAMGKDAVGALFEDRLFDYALADRVKDLIKTIPKYNRTIIGVFLRTYFRYSMHGFDMIPSDGMSEETKMTFDAEWLASYISVCNKTTGYDADKITWDMPMTMGGFCVARYVKESGGKGVERWKDDKAMLKELKRQMEEQIKADIEDGK